MTACSITWLRDSLDWDRSAVPELEIVGCHKLMSTLVPETCRSSGSGSGMEFD